MDIPEPQSQMSITEDPPSQMSIDEVIPDAIELGGPSIVPDEFNEIPVSKFTIKKPKQCSRWAFLQGFEFRKKIRSLARNLLISQPFKVL